MRTQLNIIVDEFADTFSDHITAQVTAIREQMDKKEAEDKVFNNEIVANLTKLHKEVLETLAGSKREEKDDD